MKTKNLKISLLQLELVWENPSANKIKCERYFKQLREDCHVVVLPEMFTTGFTMNPKLIAETMDGETVNWLKDWSSKLKMAICGSVVVSENDSFYNRFLFVKPDGTIVHYDKRHTFNMAGEGERYTAGVEQIIINYLGWSLFPQICYDLRFPVFVRNTMHYDAILYVANWPKTRIAAWDTLLKARAIENISYCIGVNRVGFDGNQLEYVGHSGAYDMLGNEMSQIEEKEGITSITLSKPDLNETRKKLPFLEDRDTFTLL
ncbi:amidohydrolase [Dokdonia sp. Hel_I_53]|uniref:amidohydrolase n=1 Tax=Dokdonia sp. Hel_I_53 TaxID=1566287 RepID=UPI00119BABD7|nr:amidohydrolase [Dokdonia sp. Hel_I_53]TVZ52458.1 putative amidohydrolase [Dokdonia sp. Hel_I_53]